MVSYGYNLPPPLQWRNCNGGGAPRHRNGGGAPAIAMAGAGCSNDSSTHWIPFIRECWEVGNMELFGPGILF